MGRFSGVRRLVAGMAAASLLAVGVVAAGVTPAAATTIPAGAMVLTVHTSADSTEVDLPLYGTVTDITVNWGDGQSDTGVGSAGLVPHTYVNAGTYVVAISGTALTHFGKAAYPYTYTGSDTITAVSSWGTLGITNLRGAFAGATHLTKIPPYLPVGVTDLTATFFGASAFNAPIGSWDTSHVTSMMATFYTAASFNQPIGTWDTSHVTSTISMFYSASAFNQPIGSWNTSAVTDMSNMFNYAGAFDQDISTWNTKKVTSTAAMFAGAGAFNQPIGTWKTGAVTSMNSMFGNAAAFNQSLAAWDTSAVTDMNQMFISATAFNQSLGEWNIGQVTGMSIMLNSSGLSQANYDETLIGWARQSHQSSITLGATGRHYSADGAPSRAVLTGDGWSITDEGQGANAPLTMTVTTSGAGGVDLKLVNPVDVAIDWGDGSSDTGLNSSTLAYHHYAGAGSHSVSISGTQLAGLGDSSTAHAPSSTGPVNITAVTSWGTLGLTSLSGAFSGATSLTSVPATLPPNVTDLSHMFDGASNFDQDLGGWKISQVTDMTAMLDGTASALTVPADVATAQDNYDATLIGWARQPHHSGVTFGASGRTHSADGALSRAALTGNTWVITDAGQGTNRPMELTYVATAANQTVYLPLGYYGSNCLSNGSGATSLTIDWGDGNSTGPISGPVKCPTHSYVTAGTYQVSVSGTGLTDFGECSHASDHVSEVHSWGTLGLVGLKCAFRADTRLTSLPAGLPPNVTNLATMFKLGSVPPEVAHWNVSHVTQMGEMFDHTSFNGDISGWDVSNVFSMFNMFNVDPQFNQDLSGWDTSKVERMYGMFGGAHAFNADISGWDTSKVTSMDNVFNTATAFNQPIGGWDTSNVTSMSGTFSGATAYNQPIGGWATSKVTSMYGMFAGATAFNQDISAWDTSLVTNMSFLFNSASQFNQSLGGWNLSSLDPINPQYGGMLSGSAMSTANYDSTLIGWATSAGSRSALSTLDVPVGYTSAAQAAHDYLTGTNSWTINDGGLIAGTTVTAASPVVLAGDAVPASVTYATSPDAGSLGTWVSEPTCAVYSLGDTHFTSALSGVQPAGLYATHCTGGVGDVFAPDVYVDGVLTVSQATPTVSITNMPSSTLPGDSFTPTFTTDSDGMTLATGTPGVCTVNGGTGLVSFVSIGTCALTPSVTPTPAWSGADGSAQQVSVGQASTSVSISNMPGSAVVNGSFTPTLTTSSDGAKSVTSSTTGVCSVNVGTGAVSFVAAGTCTLVAHVAASANWLAADGSAQQVSVTAAPVVVTVPSVARSVAGSPRNKSVVVSWVAPSSGGGAAIKTYKVTASPKVGSAYKSCSVSGSARSCTVVGLTNGKSYTFTVKAMNEGGKSSTTVASAGVIAGAPTGARSLVVSTSVAHKATVTWTAPQYTNSGAVTGYQVRWCTVGGSCSVWSTLPARARSASVTGRAKGTNYRVEIQAKNASGYGPVAKKAFTQAH